MVECFNSFEAQIERRAIGTVELMALSQHSPTWGIHRPGSDEGNADQFLLFLVEQLRPGRQFIHRQGGREARLAVREMTLVNVSRAWEHHQPGQFSGKCIVIPGPVLRRRLGDPEGCCLEVLSASRGAGAILWELIQGSWSESAYLGEHDARAISDNILGLLVAGLHGTRGVASAIGDSPMTHAYLRQALEYIDSNLSDPDLSPRSIADAMHISPRYLHEVLTRSTGKSASVLIREKRLEQCKRAFADPQISYKSITQIMMSWGFGNSSHFSRIFKEKYDMSPREYRSLVRESWTSAA